MPVNPFSFLAQAISDLLNSNLGLFESMGLSLFRGLAVILLAWFGIKAALNSAQGHPGFNFAKFADLLLLISFGLAMETYYSTEIPGFGYRTTSYPAVVRNALACKPASSAPVPASVCRPGTCRPRST